MNCKRNRGTYRHEYKYVCNEVQNAILKMRARGILKPDSHVGEDGCYEIRSLYFDSPENACYYENESGIGERDKYRIRIYNQDSGHIYLEKKSKSHQMTLKEKYEISETLCRKLMAGRWNDIDCMQNNLLWEMRERLMRPVIIVEYIRYPFYDPNGNVRITLDESIRSSHAVWDFLEREICSRPVLEKGKSVLEVKWDEFLPGYIKEHMQLEGLLWGSFSKYYICRKYNTIGGIKV